jgi:hypothetical protein
MKSIDKFIISFIFLLFLVSFVSAIEVKKTEFVVITDPYQNITAVVKDEAGAELQTFAGRARKFGEYRFTYHGLVSKVKLSVSIINNATEEVLVSKNFGPYTMGNPVNVTLKLNTNPGSGASVVDTPNAQNNNTNSTNVSSSNSQASAANPLTGRAVGESVPGLPKTVYYVLAGFLGVGLLIFILRKKMPSKKGTPKEPDHQKMFDKPVVKEMVKEEFKPESTPLPITPSKEAEAQEIQQKISALQGQLEQIRGEEKLIKLQRQLDRERGELKKLREDKRFNANNTSPSGPQNKNQDDS